MGHLLQGPAVSEGEKHPKLLSARAPQGDMSKLGCRESCGEVLEGLKSSHKLQAPQSPRMMEATLKHSCGTGATPTTHNTCGSRLPVTGCGAPRTAKGCCASVCPGPAARPLWVFSCWPGQARGLMCMSHVIGNGASWRALAAQEEPLLGLTVAPAPVYLLQPEGCPGGLCIIQGQLGRMGTPSAPFPPIWSPALALKGCQGYREQRDGSPAHKPLSLPLSLVLCPVCRRSLPAPVWSTLSSTPMLPLRSSRTSAWAPREWVSQGDQGRVSYGPWVAEMDPGMA